MTVLPDYMQELACALAEETDNDDFIIEVCLSCLDDRLKPDRLLMSIDTGTISCLGERLQ